VAGWVSAFKAAGMKYAVLTTRHTSGFLLWDSATSDFDVASSGNTTDVCKEFVAECRKQGLAPAFYYCLWGGKDWYPHTNARALILAQLHELATHYGEIPYFWIDMMCWAPANLSTQEIYDELKTLQPNCIVEFNQHIQDGTKIAYFPTDVLDGEMTPPPVKGHNPIRTVGGKTYYLPFDFNFVSQGRPDGCWFTYGEGMTFKPSRPFPPEAVVKKIRLGWKRGAANALVATAPDHTGRMRPEDVGQLKAIGRLLQEPEPPSPKPISLGCHATASSVWQNNPEWGPDKAVDGDSETRWGAGVGTKQGWLELDLGTTKQFDSVLIEEGWDRTQRFEVQVKENDQWRAIVASKTIGPSFSRKMPPVKARYIRLNVLEAKDVPTIWEFQLFDGSAAKR
jgi:alpha-L-fucosidase